LSEKEDHIVTDVSIPKGHAIVGDCVFAWEGKKEGRVEERGGEGKKKK
jgi:hypothetical protein